MIWLFAVRWFYVVNHTQFVPMKTRKQLRCNWRIPNLRNPCYITSPRMYCNRSATPEEAVSFNVDFRVKFLKEIDHRIVDNKMANNVLRPAFHLAKIWRTFLTEAKLTANSNPHKIGSNESSIRLHIKAGNIQNGGCHIAGVKFWRKKIIASFWDLRITTCNITKCETVVRSCRYGIYLSQMPTNMFHLL